MPGITIEAMRSTPAQPPMHIGEKEIVSIFVPGA
eukprot:COSAG02_NODE_17481_length_1000_cov_1.617092_1_plen_33_part_10